MRKGKLELRKVPGNTKLFEVVKWYPNSYYGTIDQYIESPNNTGFYRSKDGIVGLVGISCFENPESCYVITFIEEGIVEFIGNRAIDLKTIEEMKNFLFLLRKGISKSLKWKS